jgi:signal transduction histidine kinase
MLAAALIAGSIAMLTFVERSLRNQVADVAEAKAADVLAALGTPDEAATLVVGDTTEQLVQVVRDGAVVASSANVEGSAPLVDVAGERQVVLSRVPFVDAPFVVVVVDDDGVSAVVGVNIDDVVEARAAVARTLFVGVPLLLVVVGLVTWWIAGRALRPVEDIRAEVARISAVDLARRVPEPATDDEIARLAATMNAMLARLEAAQERQRRFVSDASHELRSPVASIRQHAEVAAAHPGEASVQELARTVLAEGARLVDMFTDLLLLARLDEGAAGPTAEVDLDDLVLAEAARLRDGGALEVDTTAVAPARITGHEAQLARLVRNLAANAGQHADRRVAFALRADDGAARLVVEDDGPGIPAPARDDVFDRFVRLDSARSRAAGGSGLGLAIVREVAAQHGGVAKIDDGSLGGARVSVELRSARPSP